VAHLERLAALNDDVAVAEDPLHLREILEALRARSCAAPWLTNVTASMAPANMADRRRANVVILNLADDRTSTILDELTNRIISITR
jgi:hypothetical protein